jgi:hypothetical protein
LFKPARDEHTLIHVCPVAALIAGRTITDGLPQRIWLEYSPCHPDRPPPDSFHFIHCAQSNEQNYDLIKSFIGFPLKKRKKNCPSACAEQH